MDAFHVAAVVEDHEARAGRTLIDSPDVVSHAEFSVQGVSYGSGDAELVRRVRFGWRLTTIGHNVGDEPATYTAPESGHSRERSTTTAVASSWPLSGPFAPCWLSAARNPRRSHPLHQQ